MTEDLNTPPTVPSMASEWQGGMADHVPVPYPKWLYHKTFKTSGLAVTVATHDAHQALIAADPSVWFETPADL